MAELKNINGPVQINSDSYALKLQSSDGTDYIRMRANGSDAFIEADGQNYLILDGASQGVKVLGQTSGVVRFVLGSDAQSIRTGSGEMQFWTGSTERLKIDSSGNFYPDVDSACDLGHSSKYFANAYIDAITTTGNVIVGGELEATTLDINGNADIAGNLVVDGGNITIDTDTNGSSLTWKETDGTTIAGQLRAYENRGDIYLYYNGSKTTEISAISDSFMPALHIGGTSAASGGVLQTTGNVNIDGSADISGDLNVVGDLTLEGDIGFRVINSGGFGQPEIKLPNFIDAFWRADRRFTVSVTGGQSLSGIVGLFDGSYSNLINLVANSTHVITINVANQSGVPSTGFTYPQGYIYFSFYSTTNDYSSISGRVKDKDGTYYNMSGLTDIVSNNSSYKVMRLTVPSNNYIVEYELTIVTNSNNVRLAAINYVSNRHTSQMELPYLAKTLDTNRLYGNFIVNGPNSSDSVTVSETGIVLTRSNSYIQPAVTNSTTLNIGQPSVRWGHVKVDGADFAVLNSGTERFKINSSGNATFAGSVTTGATVNVNNASVDKKISFDRTGGKGISIEHDASSIYFYNETDAAPMFKMFNGGDVRAYGEVEATSLDINGNADISGTTALGGKLTITSTSDSKLNLRTTSGDSSEWNYIDFTGTNGIRDAFFGTDHDGDPQWYREDGGVYIRLDSSKVYASHMLQVNGELEATSLDINGNADISGDLSGVDTLTAQYGRFTSTGDASATGTGHAFQAGTTSSANIIIDNNEIMARNNGVISALNFNPDGGAVNFHANTGYQTTINTSGASFPGPISGGAITSTGEIEATSLDINGNADISGNIDIHGTTYLGTTNYDGLLSWNGSDYAAAINLSEGNINNGNEIQAYEFKQKATGEPRNNLGDPTVTEMALFEQQFKPQTTLANNYDNLADLKFYKQDTSGGSWTEITSYSDDQKRKFLRTNNSSVIIPNTTYKFRVEFVGHNYTFANALSGYWSSQSHRSQVHIWKKRCSDNTWVQHTSSTTEISSWPGHMYLPFSTIPWHETNTTSSGHFNTIRIEFTPNWIPYSGSGTDYSDRDIAIYGLQVWGGYPSGRRTVHSYDQNGKLNLFGDLNVPGNLTVTGTVDGVDIAGNVTTLSGSQTVSGNKNFTGTSNQFNGHLYFNAYDSSGNHYPHYRDGSSNQGANINIRHYYGSSYKTHVMSSDASGNMLFDFQGAYKGDALDIDGNADISGTLIVGGTLSTNNRINMLNGGNSTSARIDNSGNYLNIQAKDGSSSHTQLWMGNDSDTGFYVNAGFFRFRQLDSTNIAVLDSTKFSMNGEVEATSLDINGNADISGVLNIGDSHTIGDDADDNLEIKSSSGENIIIDGAGRVILRDGGSTKLETTSGGVDVTGIVMATSGFNLPDASPSSPALFFNNDGDTGFYRNDTGSVTFSSDGSNKIRLNSSGLEVFSGYLKSTSLDVNGNADFAGDVTVNGGDIYLALSGSTQRAVASTGTNSLQVGDAGVQMIRFKNAAGISLDIAANGNATFAGSITGKDSGIIIDSIGGPYGRIHGTSSIFLGGSSTTNVQLSSALIPDGDSTRSLGSSTRYWSHGYIDAITTTGNVTSGGDLTVTGNTRINRKLTKTNNTDGNNDGDIVYFGGTTSMEIGEIYYLTSSGTWALADADAESTAKGMLGVALGGSSDSNGVLVRGMVTLDHDPGTVGDTLFLHTTAGQASSTAPSGNGDIVRVIGYCLDSTNGQIYFNPDGTFVEVTA